LKLLSETVDRVLERFNISASRLFFSNSRYEHFTTPSQFRWSRFIVLRDGNTMFQMRGFLYIAQLSWWESIWSTLPLFLNWCDMLISKWTFIFLDYSIVFLLLLLDMISSLIIQISASPCWDWTIVCWFGKLNPLLFCLGIIIFKFSILFSFGGIGQKLSVMCRVTKVIIGL
jgi:hypothetical protein